MRPIRSILVPVDFSAGSDAAIALARSLAEPLGASIELLHVWEGEEWKLPPLEFAVDGDAPRLHAEAAAHGLALQRAAGWLSELGARGMRFRARFESGRPAETIVRVAKERGHDLVVMGTHGRTGLARAVLGSVAENVVRLSAVPVLTVHTWAEPADAVPAGGRAASGGR